jgi:hypothetical protein
MARLVDYIEDDNFQLLYHYNHAPQKDGHTWDCICDECERLRGEISMDDKVKHPKHYTSGKVECLDAIEAALTKEEFRGYCKGNALKYTWREGMKGGKEDLRKATFYLERITK